MSCTITTISIYYNKLQKQLLQNSFVWKKEFGKRTCNPFLSNHVGSFYLVCTQMWSLNQVSNHELKVLNLCKMVPMLIEH
jgi:hypothetical protein